MPYADTWQAGITRAIGTNMSIEARYVGARTKDNWRTNNYNEINIIENGFLDEFKLAMANLQANNAAGGTRAGSFAYFGPGTGTAPLPIFLAYFNGIERALAPATASLYTSNQFRTTTYCTPLARFNPDPYAAATALGGTTSVADAAQQRDQRRAAVQLLPRQPRPDRRRRRGREHHRTRCTTRWRWSSNGAAPSGLQYRRQLCVRPWRRVAFLSKRIDPIKCATAARSATSRHAFKLDAVYSLPFGRGERLGSNVNGFVDRVIGGWQVAGSARVQSGRLLDLGNVRLVGMDQDELQSVFKLRTNAAGPRVHVPAGDHRRDRSRRSA